MCGNPRRQEIDRALIAEGASTRDIARQYDISKDSVHRHKKAGHVAEALEAYETETRGFRVETGAIFHRNCQRLGLGQDAVHEWLEDPDRPGHYFLGPRAYEISVVYDDYTDLTERGEPRRKKASLQTLIARVEAGQAGVVNVESKFADPRRLLTEYSAGLRGELTLFMQAWASWQEEEREKERLKAEQANAEGDLRDALTPELLAECQAGLIEAALTRRGLDAGTLAILIDEEFGVEVTTEQAARLVRRLLEGGEA